MITEEPVRLGQALELLPLGVDEMPLPSHLAHPVQAYLNSLAPSSRRPQLSALDWIARRSTQVFDAETMPWQRLRRPHGLKIRSLLEENYLPANDRRDHTVQRKAARQLLVPYVAPEG
jgi:hypothetical protein